MSGREQREVADVTQADPLRNDRAAEAGEASAAEAAAATTPEAQGTDAPPAAAEATESAGAHGGGADADEGEPAGLQRRLEETRSEAVQYLDDLRRLKAEFENYRKRMLREQTQLVERASAGLIERLLPVLDNFNLALLAADRSQDYEAMVRGVEMVFAELVEVLQKEGLERIDAVGRPFDPELHEAVMQADGEGDHLVVVDEMRPGYTLRGRVVRPAMVKVGRREKPE